MVVSLLLLDSSVSGESLREDIYERLRLFFFFLLDDLSLFFDDFFGLLYDLFDGLLDNFLGSVGQRSGLWLLHLLFGLLAAAGTCIGSIGTLRQAHTAGLTLQFSIGHAAVEHITDLADEFHGSVAVVARAFLLRRGRRKRILVFIRSISRLHTIVKDFILASLAHALTGLGHRAWNLKTTLVGDGQALASVIMRRRISVAHVRVEGLTLSATILVEVPLDGRMKSLVFLGRSLLLHLIVLGLLAFRLLRHHCLRLPLQLSIDLSLNVLVLHVESLLLELLLDQSLHLHDCL